MEGVGGGAVGCGWGGGGRLFFVIFRSARLLSEGVGFSGWGLLRCGWQEGSCKFFDLVGGAFACEGGGLSI